MHGDVCYGCGGSGKALTKLGKKALALWEAKKWEIMGRRADSIKVGEKVFTNTLVGSGKWIRVAESSLSSSSYKNQETGEMVSLWCLSSGSFQLHVASDSKVLVTSPEAIEAMFSFGKTLKGAEVVES
jgi:hypothetical protein